MVNILGKEIGIPLLLLIIAGALLVFGSMNKNSRSRKNTFKFAWLIGGIGGVLLLLPVLGLNLGALSIGGTAGTGAVVTTEDTSGVGTVCPPGNNVEDTTVTLSSVNKFTSASTGGTHRYKVNGNPALTVANAGTFTASPGDKLQVLWLNGSENDNEYYSEVDNYVVPCAGTKTFSADLYSNGSITIDVFNTDGDKVALLTKNQSFSAGDVKTLSAKITGQYQKGHPYGGIIVAEYPTGVYDDVIVDFGGSQVSMPSFYRVTNGSQATKAYSIPAIIGTEIKTGSVTVDVDDTRNPAGALTDVINLTFYPNAFYVNSKTGGSFDGPAVEDEDSTQIKKYSLQSTIPVD